VNTIHPPFPVSLGDKPELITNPYSGESIMLDPVAVAVYDCIKGAEVLGDYDIVRKGIDWFIEHYPEAYMVLLD
jgi:hypothetical protein